MYKLLLCAVGSLVVLGCQEKSKFKSDTRTRGAAIEGSGQQGSFDDTVSGSAGGTDSSTVEGNTGSLPSSDTIDGTKGKVPSTSGTIGGGTGKGNKPATTAGNTGTANKPETTGSATGTGPSPGTVDGSAGLPSITTTGAVIPPKDCKIQQKILILDFKSGWWAGDGGEFINHVVSRVKDASCTIQTLTEYHHLLDSNFSKQTIDVANATQIWILSGSNSDEEDINTSSPKFRDLAAKVVASKAPLFIGAGYGSISHANYFAQLLYGNGKNFFAPGRIEGDFITLVPLFVRSLKSMNSAVFGKGLMAGITKPLADQMATGDLNPFNIATSDRIVFDGAYEQVANCQMGNLSPTKGSFPCVGVTVLGNRKIVLDSGLQRFYSLFNNDDDMERYLHNIVRSLAE